MASNLQITSQACNLGEGWKVEIEINEMGIWSGTKAKIERRFSGGRQSARYQAASFIRGIRRMWNAGELLDTLEAR